MTSESRENVSFDEIPRMKSWDQESPTARLMARPILAEAEARPCFK